MRVKAQALQLAVVALALAKHFAVVQRLPAPARRRPARASRLPDRRMIPQALASVSAFALAPGWPEQARVARVHPSLQMMAAAAAPRARIRRTPPVLPAMRWKIPARQPERPRAAPFELAPALAAVPALASARGQSVAREVARPRAESQWLAAVVISLSSRRAALWTVLPRQSIFSPSAAVRTCGSSCPVSSLSEGTHGAHGALTIAQIARFARASTTPVERPDFAAQQLRPAEGRRVPAVARLPVSLEAAQKLAPVLPIPLVRYDRRWQLASRMRAAVFRSQPGMRVLFPPRQTPAPEREKERLGPQEQTQEEPAALLPRPCFLAEKTSAAIPPPSTFPSSVVSLRPGSPRCARRRG